MVEKSCKLIIGGGGDKRGGGGRGVWKVGWGGVEGGWGERLERQIKRSLFEV